MADNFAFTPGHSVKAASDEVTYSGESAQVQLVHVVRVTGSEGSKSVVDEAGVLSAGENYIGQVGAPLDVVSVTPTISATPAYTSGDAVGGKQTLTSAARVSGGKTALQSLTVVARRIKSLRLRFCFLIPTRLQPRSLIMPPLQYPQMFRS